MKGKSTIVKSNKACILVLKNPTEIFRIEIAYTFGLVNLPIQLEKAEAASWKSEEQV